jgi:hypothetical protein
MIVTPATMVHLSCGDFDIVHGEIAVGDYADCPDACRESHIHGCVVTRAIPTGIVHDLDLIDIAN